MRFFRLTFLAGGLWYIESFSPLNFNFLDTFLVLSTSPRPCQRPPLLSSTAGTPKCLSDPLVVDMHSLLKLVRVLSWRVCGLRVWLNSSDGRLGKLLRRFLAFYEGDE